MRFAGIDIGSRTIKLVILEDANIVHEQVTDTTFNPLDVCRNLLADVQFDEITATGYGRNLFNSRWENARTITEIKAVSIGSRHVLPGCRTIIDIGGQDTKTISLDLNGKVKKFSMNDRCAAGTGRFLEVMATALSYTNQEFVQAASKAENAVTLNSMCTVFGETEVVSLVGRGTPRDQIALGIHHSIVTRTISLMRSIPVENDILFAGGGAWNGCLKALLEEQLGEKLFVADNPQVIAALGCALNSQRIAETALI